MPLATQHSYTSQVRVVPALAPALAAAQQSVAAAAAVVACSEAAPFALRVEAGSSTPDLDHELEVLKAIEGILLVNIMNGAVLNSMGINVSIRPLRPQSPRPRVRVVCSTSQPTVLLAAREAKRRITDMLGAEVVEAAERRVQARVEARVHLRRFRAIAWAAAALHDLHRRAADRAYTPGALGYVHAAAEYGAACAVAEQQHRVPSCSAPQDPGGVT